MRVVHCKREKYDVYIGRGPNGFYGNRYSHKVDYGGVIKVATREEAIARYEADLRLLSQGELREYLTPLAGKVLGCWCHPLPCHGDVIIKLCKELGLIT